jgi:hypothetical protein
VESPIATGTDTRESCTSIRITIAIGMSLRESAIRRSSRRPK